MTEETAWTPRTQDLRREIAALPHFGQHGFSAEAPWEIVFKRFSQLEREVAALTEELDARKDDPVTRLHNICQGLEYDKKDSPYSAESWDQLVAENDELRKQATELRAELDAAKRALAEEKEQWRARLLAYLTDTVPAHFGPGAEWAIARVKSFDFNHQDKMEVELTRIAALAAKSTEQTKIRRNEMFHQNDNLFFGRTANGDVRILKFSHPPQRHFGEITVYGKYHNIEGYGGPDFTVEMDVVIPATEWASVIAQVSLHGEMDDGYQAALAFHNRP